MMNSKTRKPLAYLLVLTLIALAYIASPFINAARANPADLVGTWLGQGTYDTGVNAGNKPFDMVLSIFSFTGDSFSGVLTEQIYQTKVNVSGTFDGSKFQFTDTSYVSGNGIALNCTYTGTVANRAINGNWTYPDSLGSGSITLTKQSDTPAP